MRSFCAGCTRANTAMCGSASRSSASPMRSSSGPSTARSPSRAMPSSRAIASPVSLWSPVTITGAHAGRVALGHRLPHLLARRVDLADQAEQPRAAGQRVEAAAGSSASSSTVGEGQHAQRLRRPSPRRPARAACVSVGARRRRAHSRSTASGAPLIQTRRGAPSMRWRVAISLRVGVERQLGLARRGRGAAPPGRCRPWPPARAARPRSGRRAPTRRARSPSGGSSSASLHSAAACSSGAQRRVVGARARAVRLR